MKNKKEKETEKTNMSISWFQMKVDGNMVTPTTLELTCLSSKIGGVLDKKGSTKVVVEFVNRKGKCYKYAR